MTRNARAALTVVTVLCCLALLSSSALAVIHIPFYVTNNSNTLLCVACTGPYRYSGASSIPAGTQDDNFYTSANSVFSAFGGWSCSIYPFVGGGCCTDSCTAFSQVNFCLVDPPSNAPQVSLTIAPSVVISATGNIAASCDAAETTAFLGASEKENQPDTDVFNFTAAAGEHVTIEMTADNVQGSLGAAVHLLLKDSRGRKIANASGSVPLTVNAALPRADTYAIVVEETPKEANAFRGYYRLRVKSASGATLSLEPQRSVEP